MKSLFGRSLATARIRGHDERVINEECLPWVAFSLMR